MDFSACLHSELRTGYWLTFFGHMGTSEELLGAWLAPEKDPRFLAAAEMLGPSGQSFEKKKEGSFHTVEQEHEEQLTDNSIKHTYLAH